MTTMATEQSFKTLNARRQQAEAEIEAIDRQRAARDAAAEAQAAEAEVERRRAQARMAELAAQVDDIGRFLEEQRERERRQWHEDYDRRQELMERLRAFVNEPLPHVPRSLAEYQAELRDLDDYLSGQEHGGELWYNSETGRMVARSRAAPQG
jgi:DNA repair exonuclease SbcCD ATPase subunit